MKKSLLFVLIWLTIQSHASHIVGGEFRMNHLGGYQFKIDLIIYFDLVHGSPGSKDLSVTAKIFRNSDKSFVSNVILPLASEVAMNYSQASCAISSLMTSQLTYTAVYTLQPEIFNDPGGYYIAWERCCRNYDIENIYSDEPGASSQVAGQTFLLQFPPVDRDGVLFINSSPRLFPPLVDYACIGYPYYADFSGQDADDDSLVYSIVSPLSTHTFDALPVIGPKPYPEVTWRPSYSLQNIMGGSPDLKINYGGLLTVTPMQAGLFAFAIKCEEYRNKVKIGEVRREYQLLTVDCQPHYAPEVAAKTTGTSYSQLPLNAHFDSTVTNAERCVQVKVIDNDVTSASQKIKIRAIPIGFEGNVSGVLPETTTATLTQANSFAEFTICFDRCPPTNNSSFQIGIVTYDASCSIPLTDTVRITVTIDVPEGDCLLQSIVFPPIDDRTLGGVPFELNASATSGLPVEYMSSDNALASISASQVMMNQPGLVSIIATQSGDTHFRPAAAVEQKFCINPLPPVLTLESDGSNLILQSSSESGNLWYKDGVLQSQLTGSTIPFPNEAAVFTAKVMIDNCLSEVSNSFLVTGLKDEKIRVFPNPMTNSLNIQLYGYTGSTAIELFDAVGRCIFQGEFSGNTYFINSAEWQAGLYIMRLKTEAGIQNQKVYKR